VVGVVGVVGAGVAGVDGVAGALAPGVPPVPAALVLAAAAPEPVVAPLVSFFRAPRLPFDAVDVDVLAEEVFPVD
jgi:hypothetical protein